MHTFFIKISLFGVIIEATIGKAALDGSEGTFISNGFKLRNNDTAMNNNGQTHIYLAFAETPFKYSNAR